MLFARFPSSLVGSLLSVALAACGCTRTTDATGGPSVAASVAGAPSSAAAAPAAPVFDVHEWGLIDVVGNQARVLAGPPGGATNWNAPRRKPVLYFHLTDGAPIVNVSVAVTTSAPGFVEHFPKGQLSTDQTSLVWSGLSIRRETCPVREAPRRDAPECKTVDGQCEAAELKAYQSDDAGCIEGALGTFNHLFYRSSGPAPALPFDVAIDGGQVAITHARAADFVGSILYVHNDDGNVTVTEVAAPALGASVRLAAPTGKDVPKAQAALDATMREVGLTAGEIGAFDRAWTNDLFGASAVRELSRRAAPAPRDYLLYALPASLVDGASKVTITPAPRALKRFLLVRVFV